MGNAYCSSAHTNLGRDTTSFEAGPTGAVARWGESLEVSMGNWKENNDRTEVWGVTYQPAGKKMKHSCGYQLKARSTDSNSVESIYFGFGDSSPESKTDFCLEITRVARDGFSGGIKGIESSSGSPVSYTRYKEGYSIETTIVSYGCSQRRGLFVLEKKKKANCENAYMVTLAHCYVIQSIGLSVTAKIRRNKRGNGFGIKVEGPFKHPGDDLSKVIDKTCRTGVWSPSACPHCNNRQGEEGAGQVVERAGMFSSKVGEQHNEGLINSSGSTNGDMNHSIIVNLFKLIFS